MSSQEPRNRAGYITVEQALAEDRAICEYYEAKYGTPSSELVDVFRDEDGRLRETDDFHQWDVAWAGVQYREGLL